MNKLDIPNIILLSYLTNYDIGLMNDSMIKYSERDLIIDNCISVKRLNDKDVNSAVENTKIALQKLRYHRIKAISIFDESYPKNLKKIDTPPPIIYIKGNLKVSKSAAVIGSRKTSEFAQINTERVIRWLKDEEYSIISGLAIGIDSLAHSFSIKNELYNIAVLPNSLDSIYPKTNYGLAMDILNSKGCLVSETIFNINRGKRSFVQRNRIQAALSDVVLPIEMGTNSGTMHTINFAKKYDKKVLITRLSNELSSLSEYSGIQTLISKPSKNVFIYDDEKSFKKYLKEKDENQIKMNF